MVENPKFDVFLCHNSQDKPEVREIARQLQQQGLIPWLDEWELRPGLSWQELLEEQIEQIKTAAVFVGGSGFGPWQKREMRAFLSEFVNRGCPVIPVLLKSAPREPKLPIFLRSMTWVDFRHSESKPMARLNWGITGVKPNWFNTPQQPTVELETGVDSARTNSTSNKIYRFEIVTVDAKGQEIKREPGQAEYISEDLGNNIILDMVAIPGDKFLMGSPLGEGYDREKPQHEVTVQPFFMSKYPITQAQWKAIADREDLKVERDLDLNPAYFKDRENSARRPVEQVSWYDAIEFCQRLSKQTETEYRLPTEAEWEYACRAGTTTPFHFGETISTELANYRGTDWEYEGKVYPGNYGRGLKGIYREQTTPVGYFKVANNFGLSDMHGNVWEWCEDDWHNNYEDG